MPGLTPEQPLLAAMQVSGLWTQRPRGVDPGASLRARRRWFADGDGQSEQTTEQDAGQDAGAAGGTTTGEQAAGEQASSAQSERVEDLPEWGQRIIRELREENATRRQEVRRQQEAEQAKLAEAGNFKALAEQHAARVAALEPFQERAEALEKMIRTENTARINQIPEAMRGLVPTDYPPEKLAAWLTANMAKLARTPAPDLDAGAAGSSGRAAVALTAEEQALAAQFGLKPEDYAKAKNGG